MTGEKPEVRLEIEHRAHQPFAVFTAGFRDLGDAIEHQHWRQRQLGIARAEQLAPGARQKIIVSEAMCVGSASVFCPCSRVPNAWNS